MLAMQLNVGKIINATQPPPTYYPQSAKEKIAYRSTFKINNLNLPTYVCKLH